LYQIDPKIFRIDHAVSIVAHLLNDMDNQVKMPSLPHDTLLFGWDDTPVVGVSKYGIYFSNGSDVEPSLAKVTQNVHVMNKPSLLETVLPWVNSGGVDQ